MSPVRMSRFEWGMRLVLEFKEAFNRHDVAGMMRLLNDDCIFENTAPAPDGTVYAGKAAITQYFQDFFQATPQAHIQVEEIFGLGTRCVMRWKLNWVAEDGQKQSIRGVDLYQFKNELICEKLSYVKGSGLP
jgi:steroid delta-isomerase-like uncharacterized protein